MSTDLKLSRTRISKTIQSGGFLGLSLGILAGRLMKVAIPLAKYVLAPLEIDARIQKKMHVFGTTTLIISNEEMHGIIKILQALENSNILLKGITKQLKTKQKNKK